MMCRIVVSYLFLLLFVAWAPFSFVAAARTCTWAAAKNGMFSNPANWLAPCNTASTLPGSSANDDQIVLPDYGGKSYIATCDIYRVYLGSISVNSAAASFVIPSSVTYLTLSGAITLSSGSSGTIGCQLYGSGSIVVGPSASLTWQTGPKGDTGVYDIQLTGGITVASTALVTIQGGVSAKLLSNLYNFGLVNLNMGDPVNRPRIYLGATFQNQPGAVFNLMANGAFLDQAYSSSCLLNNTQGAIVNVMKNVNAIIGGSSSSFLFDNAGQLNILDGSNLQLIPDVPHINTGTITLSSSTSVFNLQYDWLRPSTQLLGTGIIQLGSPAQTVTIAGNFDSRLSVIMMGGTFQFSAGQPLVQISTLEFGNGQLNGKGTIVVSNSMVWLPLSNPVVSMLLPGVQSPDTTISRTITNNGTIIHGSSATGTIYCQSSVAGRTVTLDYTSTLLVQGSLDFRGDACLFRSGSNDGTVVNAGKITVYTPSTSIDEVLHQKNAIFQIQNGAILYLGEGTSAGRIILQNYNSSVAPIGGSYLTFTSTSSIEGSGNFIVCYPSSQVNLLGGMSFASTIDMYLCMPPSASPTGGISVTTLTSTSPLIVNRLIWMGGSIVAPPSSIGYLNVSTTLIGYPGSVLGDPTLPVPAWMLAAKAGTYKNMYNVYYTSTTSTTIQNDAVYIQLTGAGLNGGSYFYSSTFLNSRSSTMTFSANNINFSPTTATGVLQNDGLLTINPPGAPYVVGSTVTPSGQYVRLCNFYNSVAGKMQLLNGVEVRVDAGTNAGTIEFQKSSSMLAVTGLNLFFLTTSQLIGTGQLVNMDHTALTLGGTIASGVDVYFADIIGSFTGGALINPPSGSGPVLTIPRLFWIVGSFGSSDQNSMAYVNVVSAFVGPVTGPIAPLNTIPYWTQVNLNTGAPLIFNDRKIFNVYLTSQTSFSVSDTQSLVLDYQTDVSKTGVFINSATSTFTFELNGANIRNTVGAVLNTFINFGILASTPTSATAGVPNLFTRMSNLNNTRGGEVRMNMGGAISVASGVNAGKVSLIGGATSRFQLEGDFDLFSSMNSGTYVSIPSGAQPTSPYDVSNSGKLILSNLVDYQLVTNFDSSTTNVCIVLNALAVLVLPLGSTHTIPCLIINSGTIDTDSPATSYGTVLKVTNTFLIANDYDASHTAYNIRQIKPYITVENDGNFEFVNRADLVVYGTLLNAASGTMYMNMNTSLVSGGGWFYPDLINYGTILLDSPPLAPGGSSTSTGAPSINIPIRNFNSIQVGNGASVQLGNTLSQDASASANFRALNATIRCFSVGNCSSVSISSGTLAASGIMQLASLNSSSALRVGQAPDTSYAYANSLASGARDLGVSGNVTFTSSSVLKLTTFGSNNASDMFNVSATSAPFQVAGQLNLNLTSDFGSTLQQMAYNTAMSKYQEYTTGGSSTATNFTISLPIMRYPPKSRVGQFDGDDLYQNLLSLLSAQSYSTVTNSGAAAPQSSIQVQASIQYDVPYFGRSAVTSLTSNAFQTMSHSPMSRNLQQYTIGDSAIVSITFSAPKLRFNPFGGGSDPPPLPPAVNCQLSDWSPYTTCSAPCGGGTQSRFRRILLTPQNGGTPCGSVVDSTTCNTFTCVSSSSSTGGAAAGSTGSSGSTGSGGNTGASGSTGSSPSSPSSSGGTYPTDSSSGSGPVLPNCVFNYTADGLCDVGCGNGTQLFILNIITPAGPGGMPCPQSPFYMAPCNEQYCTESNADPLVPGGVRLKLYMTMNSFDDSVRQSASPQLLNALAISLSLNQTQINIIYIQLVPPASLGGNRRLLAASSGVSVEVLFDLLPPLSRTGDQYVADLAAAAANSNSSLSNLLPAGASIQPASIHIVDVPTGTSHHTSVGAIVFWVFLLLFFLVTWYLLHRFTDPSDHDYTLNEKPIALSDRPEWQRPFSTPGHWKRKLYLEFKYSHPYILLFVRWNYKHPLLGSYTRSQRVAVTAAAIFVGLAIAAVFADPTIISIRIGGSQVQDTFVMPLSIALVMSPVFFLTKQIFMRSRRKESLQLQERQQEEQAAAAAPPQNTELAHVSNPNPVDSSGVKLEVGPSSSSDEVAPSNNSSSSSSATEALDPTERPLTCTFPSWCVYIGYTLVFVIIVVSSFLILSFAGQLDGPDMRRWIKNHFLGILVDASLVHPFELIVKFLVQLFIASRKVA